MMLEYTASFVVILEGQDYYTSYYLNKSSSTETLHYIVYPLFVVSTPIFSTHTYIHVISYAGYYKNTNTNLIVCFVVSIFNMQQYHLHL